MPQYLSPGVYVEEVSGPRTIEGVSTSIAGFVGPTRFGPVSGTPSLLTSLSDFVAIYGSIDPLEFDDGSGPTLNYLGQAVRSFFDNGGSLLYVSRTFNAPTGATNAFGSTAPVPYGYSFAQLSGGSPPKSIVWSARYPGIAGDVTLLTTFAISPNVLSQFASSASPPSQTNTLRGTNDYDVVWISHVASPPSLPGSGGQFYWAESYLNKATGQTSWRFHALTDASSAGTDISALPSGTEVRVLTASLEITYTDSVTRSDVYTGLTFDPRSPQSFSQQFAPVLANGTRQLQVPVVFSFSDANNQSGFAGIEIAQLMLAQQTSYQVTDLIAGTPVQYTELLEWGSDGDRPLATDYQGTQDPTNPKIKTGLKALEDVTDISIVAAPGSTYGAGGNQNIYLNALQTTFNLITHCENMQYRIAVLDTPDNFSVFQISAWRGQIDSSYAALYYPWVQILDPISNNEINLPPSGFVAGIYARNDQEIGAHKAPANEVVTDALSFEVMLNKGQQDILNPLGVNCFRYFPGRGYLLWGARTATSDTEWQYVNLRRYMNFLKQSIDLGTQYVVFENNGPATWAATQQIVSDFLYSEFLSGHLFGATKDQAFFVRCDKTTMTQNDIANGRLVCLIGVALLRPAEFVIFRIGQFTASSSQS